MGTDINCVRFEAFSAALFSCFNAFLYVFMYFFRFLFGGVFLLNKLNSSIKLLLFGFWIGHMGWAIKNINLWFKINRFDVSYEYIFGNVCWKFGFYNQLNVFCLFILLKCSTWKYVVNKRKLVISVFRKQNN